MQSVGTIRHGAWSTHRRSRAVPWAMTVCRPVSDTISTNCSPPGVTGTAPAESAASRTTTSGATSGDQRAGSDRGSASGSKGKAQAPSAGQALLFDFSCLRHQRDPLHCCAIVLAIVVVPTQEFLRKVGKVMVRVLFARIWRTPRPFTCHIRSPPVQVKGFGQISEYSRFLASSAIALASPAQGRGALLLETAYGI